VFLLEIKQLIGKFTIYQYMISFLIILILASTFFYGFGASALLPILIAVLTTALLDFFIEYFKSKTWNFPYSAIISGLFIGGLLTQNLKWYVYVAAGAIAILSKHIIKFQQRHIFNPANFGVLLVSIIFGALHIGAWHTWWISQPIILVFIFGIFIIWRLRRFDLTLSFLFSYYLVNSVIELLKSSSLYNIYLSILNDGVIYFFSMYMLIEPKTNPAARKQRIIYGILVAILFVIFTQYPAFYHNPLATFFTKHGILLALAFGNIFVPILNRLKFEFGKTTINKE